MKTNNDKHRILIVDDNRPFSEGFKYLMREVLNERVELIDQAFDGEEAMKFLSFWDYDYVFMDINMPKMNGIFATKIASYLFQNVRIVAVSFNNDSESRNRMLKAGACDYLVKGDIDDEVLLKLFSNHQEAEC